MDMINPPPLYEGWLACNFPEGRKLCSNAEPRLLPLSSRAPSCHVLAAVLARLANTAANTAANTPLADVLAR